MTQLCACRETEPIVLSSKAIATGRHKEHIREHVEELMEMVTRLEQTTYGILCHAMTTAEAEAAAENIDEEIHRVQYKLDHCRRLLQGSETGLVNFKTLSEDEKATMHSRLREVKGTITHLLEHMRSDEIDPPLLTEIYAHMDEVEESLMQFHESVENTAFNWRRTRPFPETALGETIPMRLVLPVCIDAFVVVYTIPSAPSIRPELFS